MTDKADEWVRTERRLDPTEDALLSGKAAGLSALMRHYNVRCKTSGIDTLVLDNVFGLWMADCDESKLNKPELVTVLGASFGNLLCEHLQMQWFEVSDSVGITYAVRNQEKAVYCFPFEVIMKRIAGGATAFFVAVEQAVADAIADREGVVRASYDE